MKTIDTSTFDFEYIRENNRLYVDKTEYVHKLLCGSKEYFLSRPRRFGKSLLVSTLKAIFQGRRELFDGLAIDQLPYDWKTYPVIHLDLGNFGGSTPAELESFLENLLAREAKEHDATLRGTGAAMRFENLLYDLAAVHGQAVVLVDEYDKPILANVTSPEAKGLLRILKGFYGVIKTYEGKIRFALLTGVSKFSHVSIFSELNNLTDITLDPEYAALLGFTEAEIREYFADRIPAAAAANGLSEEELMKNLLLWYDGYRFSRAQTHVCNPVSVSKFFARGGEFANYWGSTGTPTFLLELAKNTRFDFESALRETYSESVFAAYELDRLPVMGLLWQTGYLTIKEVIREDLDTYYLLGFPDREVRVSFNDTLLKYYTEQPELETDDFNRRMRRAIKAGDWQEFLTLFQAFLANVPYSLHLKYEKYYQTIFFCVFELLNGAVEAESRTNAGRIDAVVRTAKTVFLFEFKLDQTADAAVGQILDRKYYEKYRSCGLPIVCVGANFDSSKGQLTGWAETTLA